MTEGNTKDIGIASDKSNFVVGLTLIIWSIAFAILVGTDTIGWYSSLLAFVFLFPPIGSYLLISSIVNIFEVVNKEKQ